MKLNGIKTRNVPQCVLDMQYNGTCNEIDEQEVLEFYRDNTNIHMYRRVVTAVRGN